jgi:hypothetical protein
MHIFPYAQEGVTVKMGIKLHVQHHLFASKGLIQQYYAYQASILDLLDKVHAQPVPLETCVLDVEILSKYPVLLGMSAV